MSDFRRVSTRAERGRDKYDAIVVGSGPGGATVSRELARSGRSVLLLERGANHRPRDSVFYIKAVADAVRLADGVGMLRALTVGGTSSLYYGSAEYPPLAEFKSLGIDLTPAVAKVQGELPLVAPAPPVLFGKQSLCLADAAHAASVPWVGTDSMAIDIRQCDRGYSFDAVWRARAFVIDAVNSGATLLTNATATRVLSEAGRAVGVEYQHRRGRRSEMRKAYADRVIVAAGALATPQILRSSGVGNVAARGFYCDPVFSMMTHVPGLKGGDLFPACMGTNVKDDGILVGDGCLSRSIYRAYKMVQGDWHGLLRHQSHVAVGVLVRDGLGGRIDGEGRFHKEFTRDENLKLQKGEKLARQILRQVAKGPIVKGPVSAAHLGGTVPIGEVVDENLETRVKNLHVCDNSVLPSTIRLSPLFTLVCLANHLARAIEA